MPKMSVITVAYNSAATIEDTILSVRAQSDADFEHIIVDGNSRDGTMGIVNRYRDGFSAVVSEPDKGIYDAMNKGIGLASGEFLGFLNSDDYFASSYSLSRIQRALETSNADGAWGNIIHVDAAGSPRRFMSGGWFKPSRLKYAIMPPHPAFYARTAAIRAVDGFTLKYKIAGDFDLIAKLLGDPAFRGVHVDELITVMRLGGVSTAGLASTRNISREIQDSLLRLGIATTPGRVRLRYLLKIMEVSRGCALALSGKRLPPGIWQTQ
jgi:glycosyltransferase involved in cell wall biosynthesis